MNGLIGFANVCVGGLVGGFEDAPECGATYGKALGGFCFVHVFFFEDDFDDVARDVVEGLGEIDDGGGLFGGLVGEDAFFFGEDFADLFFGDVVGGGLEEELFEDAFELIEVAGPVIGDEAIEGFVFEAGDGFGVGFAIFTEVEGDEVGEILFAIAQGGHFYGEEGEVGGDFLETGLAVF